MELSPRTAPDAPGAVTPRRRRSPWAYGALVLVLLGIGVVAYQALTSASLYFYNADEAVEQKAELGDKRFRLQGSVLDDVEPTPDGGVTFTVKFNGVEVAVQPRGRPAGAVRARDPGRARGAVGRLGRRLRERHDPS